MRDRILNLIYHKKSKVKFNFLILGAQKCGTSSLHQALIQHPEIFMCQPIKEPGFFLPFEVMRAYFLNKGTDIKSPKHYLYRYLLYNYKGQKCIGEASTFYSSLEWSQPALAKKIFSYNPQMKLIYLYRNKSDRIISHYFHELKKFPELEFDSFLTNPEAFGISNYYRRLKPYLEVFNRENILILNFEDLVEHHQRELERIFNFLGIGTNFKLAEFPKKNQGRLKGQMDIKEMKNQIKAHQSFTDQVEDDKLFMHIAGTKF